MSRWVGRTCANFGNNPFFNHSLQIPLQAATIHGGTEHLEVLDRQSAVLDEMAECLGLPLVQSVLLHKHIPADDLLAALAHLDHLGFQAADEVIEPTGHIHAVISHALDRLVKCRPVAIVVFADGEQPLEVVSSLVETEGGEQP